MEDSLQRKPTILHIVNSLEIGGAERVAIDLCLGLIKRGRRSILATIEGGGPLEITLKNNDVFYKLMNKKPGFRPSLTLEFLKLFKEQNIAVILTHNYSPFRYATIANLLYGKLPLIHVHHARSFERNEYQPISERFLSKFAQKIVAVSAQLKADIIKNDKIEEEKIIVIENGIDESAYDVDIDQKVTKEKFGISNDKFVLGCCARLAEEKGHEYLFQALANLKRELYDDWHLLLIGDGPLKDELQKNASRLGIDGQISFLGSRMDVPELLQLMDLFLLTSLREGMPLTILEAMAAGKAIVASKVGGIPEVLRDEQDGLLVPPKDVRAIALAIERMMLDFELRSKLAVNAKEKFVRQFSLKHTLDRYESLLRLPQ